ncbi:serine/threonine-protein kinase [Actinomadura rifamycini]|uniref:serine/threonine-protein kinase n=1 Tax=Actinomadura rifamycini TaxID=31962 RepID=UPI000424C5E5|nr:serine/threonine-protein kinase [Actinomadura rifamycini]
MSAGLVLNDRYRLLERLATGGMGEVWRARDEQLGRDVAVKLLRVELDDDARARWRFEAEGRFAAALRHDGIAQAFDFGHQHGRTYLVMELVQGEPLDEILARDGGLPLEAVLDLLVQGGRALAAAHDADIVHRDVKPANLMVSPRGELKLTDFGIARRLAEASQTQTGMVMGTAHYISPEQASAGELTPAADLYSLGVVAYECLVGAPPFDGATPVEVALKHVRDAPRPLPARVPEPARALIMEMLAKHPEERPPSATAVADRALRIRASLSTGRTLRTDLPGMPGAPATPGTTGATRTAGAAGAPRPDGATSVFGTAPAARTSAASAAPGNREKPETPVASGGRRASRTGGKRRGSRARGPARARRGGPARGRPTATPKRHTAPMSGFDPRGGPDNLSDGTVPGQRRTALAFSSIAAVLLVGAVVLGTFWIGRGADSAGDGRSPSETSTFVPAGEDGVEPSAVPTPTTPQPTTEDRRPVPTVTNRHETHRIRPTTPAPSRSTPGAGGASPTSKPTSKPTTTTPGATPTDTEPTPSPTDVTTSPSTPTPDPSATQSGGLGSGN